RRRSHSDDRRGRRSNCARDGQRTARRRSRTSAPRRAHRKRLHGAARKRAVGDAGDLVTNRAIGRLSFVFILLFAALAIRQTVIAVVEGPSIASRPNNPRHALLDVHRGRILATDGTVLAQTQNGKRVYPMGAALAQPLGYLSARYGTSGLED